MCLHLRPGDKETIAKEDIVCYKIAKRITYKNHPSGKDPDPVVMTPFCGAVITEDMIKDGDPLTPKRRTCLQVWRGIFLSTESAWREIASRPAPEPHSRRRHWQPWKTA